MWHGRNWEEQQKEFKSNRNFWIPKIERNIERDREVNQFLTEHGWIVIRFWETEIRKNLQDCIAQVKEVYDKKA